MSRAFFDRSDTKNGVPDGTPFLLSSENPRLCRGFKKG